MIESGLNKDVKVPSSQIILLRSSVKILDNKLNENGTTFFGKLSIDFRENWGDTLRNR